MGQLKNKVIGHLFDLLMTEKNFTEMIGKVIKKDGKIISNELLFQTPYVGSYNWIKIVIPFNFSEELSEIELEFKIGSNLYTKKVINNIDSFFDILELIEKQ